MTALVKETLGEQAYRELRERIVSGRLPIGARLLPEDLAIALSISQTPIKEALVRLAADGLVDAPLRRGTVVRRLSPNDVRELYEARILIEVNALRTGMDAKRLTPEVIGRLEAIFADHLAHTARGAKEGIDKALELDRTFHSVIVSLGNNQFIVDWHTRILRQTHTVFLYSSDNYTVAHIESEHRAIISAASQGRKKEAVEALRRHLLRSREDMLASLE